MSYDTVGVHDAILAVLMCAARVEAINNALGRAGLSFERDPALSLPLPDPDDTVLDLAGFPLDTSDDIDDEDHPAYFCRDYWREAIDRILQHGDGLTVRTLNHLTAWIIRESRARKWRGPARCWACDGCERVEGTPGGDEPPPGWGWLDPSTGATVCPVCLADWNREHPEAPIAPPWHPFTTGGISTHDD